MKKNILAKSDPREIKPGLHPRNRHNTQYDFKSLIESSPELKNFVSLNKFQNESIDFSNAEAVKTLNKALLKFFYHINFWEIPTNYLCPPIPGRADYIHQVADLLGSQNNGKIPTGSDIKILDIGVGANCVYPLIANAEYGWHIVGSDIDLKALENAQKIIDSNELSPSIQLRQQSNTQNIFAGIINSNDQFNVSISNPPFHSSLAEAISGNQRKNLNLKNKNQHNLNFGGIGNELWCSGGEVTFISQMIKESQDFKNNVFWFTSLVSKMDSLPKIIEVLKITGVRQFKTIDMAQGQKKSRIIAWSYR